MKLLSTRRRRFTPLALGAGLVASAVLGLGATGTFSAITATITNSNDTVGTGSIVMKETDNSNTPSATCLSTDSNSVNSSTCSSSVLNKYGGYTLSPGTSGAPVSIRIYNVGTMDAAAFNLTPAACTVSGNPATSICDYIRVGVTCIRTVGGTAGSSVPVFGDGTLANSSLTKFNTAGTIDLKTTKNCTPAKTAANSTSDFTTFTFTVTVDSTAPNAVQGQTASQNLEWKFQA